MKQEAYDMVERIMDTEMMGYAYLYPRGEEMRNEYLISTTPENLANFIGSHFTDAGKMVITDVMDRLIVDTVGGFLDTCPDQKLCRELIGRLAPIQMGEQEPGEILAVDREMSEEYFREEDQMITMMELSMG